MIFKSQELWDLVENGYEEPDPAPTVPDQRLRENRKRDSRALALIQSALEDDIFSRISVAYTSKQAWDILKQEYLGDKKCIYCSQMGHKEDDCWAKQREEQKQAHFIENVEEENLLFMFRSPIQCDNSSKDV
ncbi:hypothetical protein V6N11_019028 [Hibiscus sabdariffa]|uniref:CCHC-type domain-containing protein n=1 Tax=Hibiscus sabdariffa TaxID=183260 RepID=A0ABR2R1E6_9ROSI